jgi:hypothetical protein
MSSCTVIFVDGSPLWLSGIRRYATGRVSKGYVINGSWELTLGTDTLYAFANNGWETYLITERPYSTYEEVTIEGCYSEYAYNDVIAEAEVLLGKQREDAKLLHEGGT